MRKKILSLSYFAISLLLFIQSSCLAKNTGHFTLINNSHETISHAAIEICNQLFEIRNIKPNGNYSASFQIKGDSHYTISILFISGKKLKKQIGYVTNGFDFTNKIIITDSNISIADISIK